MDISVTSQHVTFFHKVLLHFSVRLYSCDLLGNRQVHSLIRLYYLIYTFLSFLTHSFQDTLNSLFTYSLEAETPSRFIFHYPYYKNEDCILILLASICDTESSILDQNESSIINTLIYGNDNLSQVQNTDILNPTVKFLLSSMRFEFIINWIYNKSTQTTCLNRIHLFIFVHIISF